MTNEAICFIFLFSVVPVSISLKETILAMKTKKHLCFVFCFFPLPFSIISRIVPVSENQLPINFSESACFPIYLFFFKFFRCQLFFLKNQQEIAHQSNKIKEKVSVQSIFQNKKKEGINRKKKREEKRERESEQLISDFIFCEMPNCFFLSIYFFKGYLEPLLWVVS